MWGSQLQLLHPAPHTYVDSSSSSTEAAATSPGKTVRVALDTERAMPTLSATLQGTHIADMPSSPPAVVLGPAEDPLPPPPFAPDLREPRGIQYYCYLCADRGQHTECKQHRPHSCSVRADHTHMPRSQTALWPSWEASAARHAAGVGRSVQNGNTAAPTVTATPRCARSRQGATPQTREPRKQPQLDSKDEREAAPMATRQAQNRQEDVAAAEQHIWRELESSQEQ